MKKGQKGFYIIIPENIHKLLKLKAVNSKTTMTDMFVDWVKKL